VTAERPDSVLTALTSSSGVAVLHDATAREDFRRMELTLVERNALVPLTSMLVSGLMRVQQTPEDNGAAGNPPTADKRPTAPAESDSTESRLPPKPLPLHVQPGEAASEPRSDASTTAIASAEKIQPRGLPTVGDTADATGTLRAHSSPAFRDIKTADALPSRIG